MSLATGLVWEYKDIKLTGYSLAGISTSVAYPAADACFDVAQGLPFQIPINNLLITHGHLDHASGIPYLIGQKAMRGVAAPKIYMPKELVPPMNEVMRLWGEIEDHSYGFEFHAVRENLEYPLKGNYFFKTFPTYHRVPSTGYTVYLRKKRLNPKYLGLGRGDLANLRRAGEVIEEKFIEPQVSFTGDTRIEFLNSPQVRESRVLVMEVTYWDDKKSVQTAREWGHIHFDELLPRLGELNCEKILLIHSSVRYSVRELQAILDRRLPEGLHGRVALFPRP